MLLVNVAMELSINALTVSIRHYTIRCSLSPNMRRANDRLRRLGGENRKAVNVVAAPGLAGDEDKFDDFRRTCIVGRGTLPTRE